MSHNSSSRNMNEHVLALDSLSKAVGLRAPTDWYHYTWPFAHIGDDTLILTFCPIALKNVSDPAQWCRIIKEAFVNLQNEQLN